MYTLEDNGYGHKILKDSDGCIAELPEVPFAILQYMDETLKREGRYAFTFLEVAKAVYGDGESFTHKSAKKRVVTHIYRIKKSAHAGGFKTTPIDVHKRWLYWTYIPEERGDQYVPITQYHSLKDAMGMLGLSFSRGGFVTWIDGWLIPIPLGHRADYPTTYALTERQINEAKTWLEAVTKAKAQAAAIPERPVIEPTPKELHSVVTASEAAELLDMTHRGLTLRFRKGQGQGRFKKIGHQYLIERYYYENFLLPL